MPRPGSRPPELAIPVASLAALRRALADEVGSDAAARALAAAGHAAGDALFSQLVAASTEGAAPSVADMSENAFWRRLSQLFSGRGWGTLAHVSVHGGVGALEAADWVEADASAGATRPSCFFSTGMLANLLGNAAGAPIAVLEVECRSQGGARCRFLFGSSEAMHAVYERVGSGQSVDAALTDLA
ncbi:MAG: V4R domain-containing protein [Gemmatimonadota bacterium]